MSVAALIAWVLTAGLGLYMFTTWLIEEDGSTGPESYRRLRAPVVFSHAGLALSGLAVWLLYVYIDSRRLAWTALIILLAVAALGLIMFTRWIPVHRLDAGSAWPRRAWPRRRPSAPSRPGSSCCTAPAPLSPSAWCCW
jgi:manganese efflux pump family protein